MALTDSITHYWKLDESSGNATDSVGSLTLTNTNSATYSTGLINNGVVTTNSSDRLEASNDGGIQGGAVSISLWIKMTTDLSGGTTQAGFFQVSDAGTQVSYIIGYEYGGGTPFVEVNRQKSAVANVVVTYNITLGTTTWHHIVLTYDTTTMRIYVDGTDRGNTATSGNGTSGVSDLLQIAYSGGYLANSPVGTIDEVGTWSRALSSTEVTELYNGGAGVQYPFSAQATSAFVPRLTSLRVG